MSLLFLFLISSQHATTTWSILAPSSFAIHLFTAGRPLLAKLHRFNLRFFGFAALHQNGKRGAKYVLSFAAIVFGPVFVYLRFALHRCRRIEIPVGRPQILMQRLTDPYAENGSRSPVMNPHYTDNRTPPRGGHYSHINMKQSFNHCRCPLQIIC